MTQTQPTRKHGDLLLRMSGVSKQFGAVTALGDIELEVHAGEVVALVGDNGAGKTTLVKVLAGVHQPTSGTIEYLGEKVTFDNPRKALEMGIATVFQDLALCENLDVVANLFLGQEVSPWRLNEVEMEVRAWKLLKELAARIPSVREPIASLSGGQRQTVAIARSLVMEPEIIMLDEPTAALGVAQTAEVLNLIERVREMQTAGATDLAFLTSLKNRKLALASAAGALVVPAEVEGLSQDLLRASTGSISVDHVPPARRSW